MKPLGEVAVFLDHLRRPVKSNERNPGPYPYFGANGQQGTIDGFLFDEPLVLLAEDGGHFDNPDRGIAYRISGRTWVNNHAHVLRARAGVDRDYLYRVLENFDARPYLTGSTRAKLTKGSASRFPIPLPPLAEQKRIAAVLDQVDTLRAKRREAITLLDDLAQSIFLDMFGNLPASARLSDLAHVQGGLQLSGTRSSLPCEVPYLRVANVYRGYLQLNEIKKLKATPQEIERTRLETGDLLIVEGHGNPNEIGRAALWDGSIDNCTHQNHLIRIRVDRRHLIPEYLEMYLNSIAGRRHLLGSANTTSGLNTISTGAVKGNPIPVPSMDQQRVFLGRLEQLRRTMRRHRTHLAALDELFVSLQQRAFSGTLWDHDGEAGAA